MMGFIAQQLDKRYQAPKKRERERERERERKRIPPKLNGWSKRRSQRKVYNNKCVREEKKMLSDKQPNKEPEK